MLKVNKDMSTALSNNASLSTNSPVIPDSWVMVPKEPTQAMIKAWLSEVANWRGHVVGYKAAHGGVTVSKSRVDSWLRSSSATKNATGIPTYRGNELTGPAR